jgi:hypothetical protein
MILTMNPISVNWMIQYYPIILLRVLVFSVIKVTLFWALLRQKLRVYTSELRSCL